jgi:hypothetical protein
MVSHHACAFVCCARDNPTNPTNPTTHTHTRETPPITAVNPPLATNTHHHRRPHTLLSRPSCVGARSRAPWTWVRFARPRAPCPAWGGGSPQSFSSISLESPHSHGAVCEEEGGAASTLNREPCPPTILQPRSCV